MPKHPDHPKALRTMALANIVKNADSVWCAQFIREMSHKHMLFVEGPFDNLTPEDCHTILDMLADRKVLKKHHIYLLVSPVSLKFF
jgi:hypothetical protein